MSTPLSVAVSPAIEKISLTPGETYEGEFFVSSLNSGENLAFSVDIAPLNFQNETYDLEFSAPGTFNQIVDWTSLEPGPDMTVTENPLPSNPDLSHYDSLVLNLDGLAARPVRYKITVPEDAPAGGQYLAFLIQGKTVDPDQSSDSSISVKNNSQVAVLLYATVAGETHETGSILENKVQGFSLGSPVKASSRLENTGNTHLIANYTLRVFSLLDQAEVYSNEETPVENTIIPKTSLYSEQTWNDTPVLGLFRVSQEISFAGETETSESLVVVAPIWFLVLILAFLAAVVYSLVERISLRKQVPNPPEKSRKKS